MPPAEPLGESPNASTARSGSEQRYQAQFTGTGNDYFEIALINWLLMLITLGLFTAWARIRTYRFFHASTRLGGHEFRFTGEGWPLFWGILLAAVLLGSMQLLFTIVFEHAELAVAIVLAVFYALLLDYLGHYAYFRSRRYRFAHTTYREIRFRLLGSPSDFAMGALVRSVGMVLTLGLLYPLYKNYVYRSIYNNLRYGNLRFRYTGDDDEYMRVVIPGFIVVLLTLGVYYFWWYPRVYKYFVDHLYVEKSRLHTSEISAEDMFNLRVGNYLLTVLTLGLGAPFAAVRSARFFVDRLRLEGPLDLDDAVQQYRGRASTLGEGMIEELDMDVDLGF